MKPRAAVVLIGSLLAAPSCTRTVYVPVSSPQPASAPAPESRSPAPRPEPPRERPAPAPATAATLGIPPGHLPDPGECRIWIPGTPPGRQRYERSAVCTGISQAAPAGSWIVYRPSRDHKLVHIRVTDRNRPGSILVVHVFEIASGKFLRDEAYSEPRGDRVGTTTTTTQTTPQRPPQSDPRRTPEQRPAPTYDPGTDRPIPVIPPPTKPEPATDQLGPGSERRKPTSTTTPPTTTPTGPAGPTDPSGPNPTPGGGPAVAPLDIPPGHLPNAGECRIWIPGTPPGRQPHRASAECDRITREAPAGSWVVYRPTANKKLIHVRVVDARRAGVIEVIRVYDETGTFVREEKP